MQMNKPITVSAVSLLAFFFLLATGWAQKRPSQPPAEDLGQTMAEMQLSGTSYWNYEALGRIVDVHQEGELTKGHYLERMKKVPFSVKKIEIDSVANRTQGYKTAIDKMLIFLTPGNVPENKENQAYLIELQKRLQGITGEKFATAADWNTWWNTERDHLVWSGQSNRLVRVSR